MPKDKPELTPRLMSEKIVKKMKYGGLSPKHQSLLMRIIGNFWVFIIGLIIVLSITDYCVSDETTISKFLNEVIILVGFLQICAKYYISCRQATEISLSIDTVWFEFWSIDNGVLNPEERNKMYFVYRVVDTIVMVYTYVIYVTVAFYILQTFLNQALIINVWLPNNDILKNTIYFHGMLAFQSAILFISVHFSVVQVDNLFTLFICFLYVQLNILKKKILLLDGKNTKKANNLILKESIVHHNKLLKFLENLSFVYGKIFLPAVITNYSMMTLSLYCFVSEDSLDAKIKFVGVFSSAFFQTLSYCFAGQILQDQGLEIAHAAYNSNWTEITDTNIRKGILMIIIRSQKKLELTVGGILILDMERLAIVLKSCFSFLTFLTNVKHK